jgi:diaminopimelate epimerase
MIEFFKYQGTGNDFIVINDIENVISLKPESIVSLCDRHFGIGSDGLILLKPSEIADYYMDFYNSDGTKAEMCGNGIRCLAAYIIENLMQDLHDLKIETLAGVKSILIGDETYSVDMGVPSFAASDIPVELSGYEEIVDYPLSVAGDTYNITCVSMGNPHAVIFGDKNILDIAPIVGPVIENSPEFPKRTNIEFVNLFDSVAEVIVWERGVGLTLACGTGACAVLAAAKKLNKVKKSLFISLPGGDLKVKYNDNGSILLTGPAKFVYKGKIDI